MKARQAYSALQMSLVKGGANVLAFSPSVFSILIRPTRLLLTQNKKSLPSSVDEAGFKQSIYVFLRLLAWSQCNNRKLNSNNFSFYISNI